MACRGAWGSRWAAPCHRMAGLNPTGSPASSEADEAGATEAREFRTSKVDGAGAGSISCNKRSKESGRGLEAANGK